MLEIVLLPLFKHPCVGANVSIVRYFVKICIHLKLHLYYSAQFAYYRSGACRCTTGLCCYWNLMKRYALT